MASPHPLSNGLYQPCSTRSGALYFFLSVFVLNLLKLLHVRVKKYFIFFIDPVLVCAARIIVPISLLKHFDPFLKFSKFTEEKLGQAEKTELDVHLENLLARADCTKNWTEKIFRQTEVLLQPNPSEALPQTPNPTSARVAPKNLPSLQALKVNSMKGPNP